MTEDQLKNLILKARGVTVESIVYSRNFVGWSVPYGITGRLLRETAWIKDLKRQTSATGKALSNRRHNDP